MAPPVFTISSARQKFFDLFQAVTSRQGRKVIITSRDREAWLGPERRFAQRAISRPSGATERGRISH